MLLNQNRLLELARALDGARALASEPGQGAFCTERFPSRAEAKPGLLPGGKGRANRLPPGCALETVDGMPYLEVPGGYHGRAFLVIDTETGDVACGHCKGVRS